MEIDIPARLVHRDGIKAHTDKAAHPPRFIKGISSGVVGDDRPEFF